MAGRATPPPPGPGRVDDDGDARPLLTIAIPTYHRADHLDRRLGALARELNGHEGACVVFVSDNASPDRTPDVVARWAGELSGRIPFRSSRNADNCGVMRNIALCLRSADTPFVWLVGDDDELVPGVLGRILAELRAHPDLHLLGLNYSMHRVSTGEVLRHRRYEFDRVLIKDGPGPLHHRDDAGAPVVPALGFMTAQIYRTESVLAAVRSWPEYDNYEIQIYWGAACALQGTVRLRPEVEVRYACGENVLAVRRNWYRARTCDAPRVYTRLLRLGYPASFARELILSPVTRGRELRLLASGFWRWPRVGLTSLVILAGGLGALHEAEPEPVEAALVTESREQHG